MIHDTKFLSEYMRMMVHDASTSSHSCYNDLACRLIDVLMDDEEKNRFRLHILANGGCASPHDVVDFSSISSGKEDKVEEIVGGWLSSTKGNLIHQAYLNSCFDNNFMREIADAAWRNRVC
jgi:hypothetical protein